MPLTKMPLTKTVHKPNKNKTASSAGKAKATTSRSAARASSSSSRFIARDDESNSDEHEDDAVAESDDDEHEEDDDDDDDTNPGRHRGSSASTPVGTGRAAVSNEDIATLLHKLAEGQQETLRLLRQVVQGLNHDPARAQEALERSAAVIKRQIKPGHPLPSMEERERAMRASLDGVADDAAEGILSRNKAKISAAARNRRAYLVSRIKAAAVAQEAAWANKAPLVPNRAGMSTDEARRRLRTFLASPNSVRDVAQAALKGADNEAQDAVRKVLEDVLGHDQN